MSILARASSLACFSSVMKPLHYRHKKGDASSDERVSLCNCEHQTAKSWSRGYPPRLKHLYLRDVRFFREHYVVEFCSLCLRSIKQTTHHIGTAEITPACLHAKENLCLKIIFIVARKKQSRFPFITLATMIFIRSRFQRIRRLTVSRCLAERWLSRKWAN